jgi:hypothetical protein
MSLGAAVNQQVQESAGQRLGPWVILGCFGCVAWWLLPGSQAAIAVMQPHVGLSSFLSNTPRFLTVPWDHLLNNSLASKFWFCFH